MPFRNVELVAVQENKESGTQKVIQNAYIDGIKEGRICSWHQAVNRRLESSCYKDDRKAEKIESEFTF